MLNFLLFILLALYCLIVLFVMLSSLQAALMGGVPFVYTSKTDIVFIAKELGMSSNDTLYELGSGYGRTAFLFEKVSGAKVVGFELALWAHILALLLRLIKNSKVEFKHRNFFKVSWKEAKVIYCYLFPPLMAEVEKKYLAEARVGSRLVSRDFPLPGLLPTMVFKRPKGHAFFVYVK